MNIEFILEVQDVEDDADIEIIRARLEQAVRLAMPYHYIELNKTED